MTASQLPGQTLQPVPPSAQGSKDTEWSLLQKCVELSRQWGATLSVQGMTGDPHDDEYALWGKLNQNLYNIAQAS